MGQVASATRVAEMYLRRLASAGPVPLTSEQKTFMQQTAKAMLSELKSKLTDSQISPNYVADTKYQTGKPYVKDAFGRKSVLAGVPHARVQIDVTIVHQGNTYRISWVDQDGSPLDFLLSADGQIVIIKDDTHWGRGTRSPTAHQLGSAWADFVLRRFQRAVSEQFKREDTIRLRQEEEAKQKQQEEEAKQKQQEAEAKRKQQEAEAKRKQQEEEAANQLLSGDGKGYTVHTIVPWDNDDLDVDEDEDSDPATGVSENSTSTVKNLRDVGRMVFPHHKQSGWLRSNMAVFSRSWTRKYNARGIYGLTRYYVEEVRIMRADKQPFNESEVAFLNSI